MRVILLERVPKLGFMGDLVNVKPGYARNYLLPQGKALKDTPANLKYFESRRTELEARNIARRQEAEQVAERLDGQEFVLIRSAADTGSLYGSVSKTDIVMATTAQGVTIARGQIELERPIKMLGIHRITVNLHPEVDSSIAVNVARTTEEAEALSSGKSLSELTGEADEDEIEAAGTDEEVADETTDPAEAPVEAAPDED